MFQGSRAVTPLFVQTGKDVLLELQADVPKKFIALQWSFNGSANLVSFSSGGVEISDSFTGRVEVCNQSYSVKLKNLQKSDSGVYSATQSAAMFLTRFTSTPPSDPVSPVTLTVHLLSSSSDSCNLTVSCGTQELHHINSTLTCDNKTCRQEGGERSKVTTSGSTLSIYLVKDTIICNHSNQVSWRKDNEPFDLSRCSVTPSVSNGAPVVLWSLLGLLPVIIACILLYIKCKSQCADDKNKTQRILSLLQPHLVTVSLLTIRIK
uniref:Immunoglobulin V-set domain-containing protein n=1 Tax=Echeneis naucrates TaxID=173247 RepID=A0A665UWK9_ECHNA